MAELSPKERRFQRTQQAILDAAREIINQQGVEALSIRAIADKIDYSPAGLYEYYGSKEEIVGALCRQGLHHFARHLRSVDQRLAPEEYMIELGVAYVDFALKNPDFFLLMFTTAPLVLSNFGEHKADAEQALQDDDAFSILLRGVERCVAVGLFKPQPDYGVLEMARTAWSLVHGIAMLQLSALRDMPFTSDQIRTALRIQFRGMKLLAE
ncbi:MAG: TetR/AcrR family transcriptional regulator [Caldilineaceae bacterium]